MSEASTIDELNRLSELPFHKKLAEYIKERFNSRLTLNNKLQSAWNTTKDVSKGVKNYVANSDFGQSVKSITSNAWEQGLSENPLLMKMWESHKAKKEEAERKKLEEERKKEEAEQKALEYQQAKDTYELLEEINDNIIDLRDNEWRVIVDRMPNPTIVQSRLLIDRNNPLIIDHIPNENERTLLPNIEKLVAIEDRREEREIERERVTEKEKSEKALVEENRKEDIKRQEKQTKTLEKVEKSITKMSKQKHSATQSSSLLEKILAFKLLGGKAGLGKILSKGKGLFTTAGTLIGRYGGTPAKTVLNAGKLGIGGAVRGIGGLARGAMAGVGALGAGTVAATTAALISSATALKSGYRFLKGEDASNWISKGFDKITGGDENNTLGGRIYDALHDKDGKNKIGKYFSRKWDRFQKIGKVVSKGLVNRKKDEKSIVTEKPEIKAKDEQTITTSGKTIVPEIKSSSETTKLFETKLKNEVEKETFQPVIINNNTQQNTTMAGGVASSNSDDMLPMVTRPMDSALARAADRMTIMGLRGN